MPTSTRTDDRGQETENPFHRIVAHEQAEGTRVRLALATFEEEERSLASTLQTQYTTMEQAALAAAQEELRSYHEQELAAFLRSEQTATDGACSALEAVTRKRMPPIIAGLAERLLSSSHP